MDWHRLAGVFAFLMVASAWLAFGCATNGKKSVELGCGGDACGSACGGCGPCGGAPEGDGDALENKFADSWTKAVELTGDADAGKRFYYEEVFDAGMACVACHSFDKGDTMTTDADSQIRAAVSVYASTFRDNVKGMGSHNATLGGNLCVPYWQNGPKEGATPQQLADIDAFLKRDGGDKSHATADNIAYKSRKFTIPEDLTGGDAARGAELADKYCLTCHAVDGKEPIYDLGERKLKGGSVPAEYLSKVAKRIKDEDKNNNDFMPGFPDERMPVEDLLDLLAFFEKK